MFKNLDGFKKIKEDDKSVVMQHPKGHTITVAMKSLPALHQKQLRALPMHKMAAGGKVQKYADGTANAESDDSQSQPDQAPAAQSDSGASGSWDDPQAAAPAQQADNGDWQGSSGVAPPDQAQPAAQPQQAQAPQQGMGGVSPTGIYGLEAQGIKGQAAAEGQQANQAAAAEQDYQANLQKAQNEWQVSQNGMLGDIGSALKDVATGHIDAKHYQENQSTGQKVATAIGLFLGGLSTPFTHQGNPALEILNKQIDRDIDAQKAGLNNKMNVYNAYLSKYHNAAAAENMARATQLGIYASKLRQAADQSGSAQAQARAQIGLGQLQQQIYPLVQKANFLKQTSDIDQNAKGSGQLSPIPPEKLIQFSGAPQEDQNKMFEEVKNAQNVNNIRNPSLEAFDKAAKEVRPLTGGTGTKLTSIIPGMESPAQKQWQGLANTTVKEIEGTARKAAMDSISKNFMPQFGDSDSTIKSKRQGWQNYLSSQSSAPVAKGYGIDLQNYQSTTSRTPDIKMVNGVRYMRGQNGQAIPVK